MYRNRCRPAYSPEQLREMYATPHSSMQASIIGPDHADRIERTFRLADKFITSGDRSGADLSCGDGRLIDHYAFMLLWDEVYKGDFAPGYEFTGPIEETIHLIPEVDVFFLTETIEHCDDPDLVLALIRQKAKKLILSTPDMSFYDENLEHYWAWDVECVLAMLCNAGWEPVLYDRTTAEPGYVFQIHAAM